MIRLLCLISLSLSASLAQACAYPFGPEAIADTANELLHARQFAVLETMAANYRAHGGYTPEGQPAILDMYDGLTKQADRCAGIHAPDADWKEQEALLTAWRKAMPKSVTARIAMGAFQRALGWHLRSGNFAAAVSEQQWKGFREAMAVARQTLDTTVKPTERDAGWYAAMLDIGLAQQWTAGDFDALSDKATSLYPTYLPLYVTSAYYHSSNWYGSAQEFAAYVDKVAASTSKAWGETLYARLHHAQRSKETAWPRMKAGWERITTDFPVAHNLNNFGSYACTNNDYPALKTQLARIGEQIIEKNWGSKQRLVYCRALQDGPVNCFKVEDSGELVCRPVTPKASAS